MRFIDEIEGLVSSQLHVIKATLSMIKLEARLALMSIYPLIINVCMVFVVLFGAWVSLLVLMGYALMQVVDSLALVLSIVFILNWLTLGLLLKYLLFNLKSMSFEKTRAYLSRGNDELKKKGHDVNCHTEPTIIKPTKPAE